MKKCAVLCLGLLLSFSSLGQADSSGRAKIDKIMALTGDDDYADLESAWDRTYSRKDYVFGKDPSDFLKKNVALLPKGRALDIAMGEGRNTVYLAKQGFISEGVDISMEGIRKAETLAKENHVRIEAINSDLATYKIKPNRYSVIINFYYLQRSLFAQIKAGLKKGGVVVFETYTTEQLKNPSVAAWAKEYLLTPGELKAAFSDFNILYYAETNDGHDAVASLIARKP